MAAPLSDSMRRRLEKEQEAYASHAGDEGDGAYPALPDDQDQLAQKLEKMPTPPPDYPPAEMGRPGKYRSVPREDDDDDDADERRRLGGDDGDELDPEFDPDVPTSQMAIEGIISLVFDVGLMVAELIINFWLALLLRDQGRSGHYTAALLLIFVPSIFNAVLWVRLSKSYKKRIGFLFMLAIVFIGFPSPILVYIWHIYLTAFCLRAQAQRSKILANCFRMVQAFSMSLPLILLNLYTLLSILKVDDENLDLSNLTKHLSEGINVRIHGLAAVISFVNIMRAASLYNERTTYTLLFVMVCYPFLLFTILSRIIALGIVACFLEFQWTILLFLGLVLTNLALYYVCRKRVFSGPGSSTSSLIDKGHYNVSSAGHKHNKVDPERGSPQQLFHLQEIKPSHRSSIEDSMENIDCCCPPPHDKVAKGLRNRDVMVVSNEYADGVIGGGGFWESLPKTFLLSICSSVIPAGYTNDRRSHHPLRLKGGMFVLLNFFFNTVWIGLALGFTIVHNVPNTLHGVAIPQPSLKVEVPGSKVIVQAGGLDVSLNLPNTKLDLGTMPQFSATLNTDSTDAVHAVLFPIVLAGLAVPFVVMRAVMMELDCFVARKKEVGMENDQFNVRFQSRSKRRRQQRSESLSISEMVKENNASRELKFRLYVTLCCSVMGMVVFTIMLLMAGGMGILQFL